MALAIQNLDCRYTVPRSFGTDSARARLDQVALRMLPAALAAQAAALPGEDVLYFIDRLDTAFTLRHDLSDYDAARAWAASIWSGLDERLRHADGVTVFRGRAEFIAAFLFDLAAGVADHVWYYRRLLEPLGLASGDRAARLLAADPDTGRDALTLLHRDRRLDDVLRLLSDSQIEAIVSACLLPPAPDLAPASSIRRWKTALLEIISGGRFTPSSSPARDTLLLYLEMLHAHPELGPDVHLARFVSRLVGARSVVPPRELSAALRTGDWDGIRPLLPSSDHARFFATLLQAMAPQEAAKTVEAVAPATEDTFESRFTTEHAGVFLLAAAALEIESHAARDPLALYLAALQCLGAAHSTHTAPDRAIAAFAGLDASPSPPQLDAQLSAWTPPSYPDGVEPDPWFNLAAPGAPLHPFTAIDAALQPFSQDILRRFRRRLGALSESTLPYIYETFFHCRGVVTVSAARISVRFVTCPLRMVLRMAGFANPAVLPWAASRSLELDFD